MSETPLDEVCFLTRSQNRVAVVEALASGPRERDELRSETGIHRVTLARTLEDLTERGLISKTAFSYRLTPFGELVSEDLGTLLETVEIKQRFDDVAQWLPANDFGFDLRRLEDAEVVVPCLEDSIAPIRRSLELLTEATEVRGVTSVIERDALRVHWERVLAGEQRLEIAFTERVIGVMVGDDLMRAWLRELISSEGTEIYRLDDECRHILGVLDGAIVKIGLIDDDGFPRALVVSEDSAVVAWAKRTVESYHADAELCTSDSFEMRDLFTA